MHLYQITVGTLRQQQDAIQDIDTYVQATSNGSQASTSSYNKL